ncbi:MAG: FAD-dependent monooxygenase [Herminiimonas sp.]|nr:FAD-dependent monooxygenase [Herminiimonas sp.]
MARILVVGGSLGGLLAANILVRNGHRVQVIEKAASSLDGRGAGIVTHEALFAGLRRAGVTVDASVGVEVTSRVALGPDGEVVARLPVTQTLSSWSRLYQLLREALPEDCLVQGTNARSVTETADGVTLHCDGERHFEGDLLLASDGLRSVVRAQFAPEIVPEYAGYVGWRGVCDESVLSQSTMCTVFDCFGFGLPPGEQLIGYPVAGAGNATTRGRRRFNFVWYRPAASAAELAALLTDADGVHHPLGIPPNKVAWRQVAAMRTAARELLAPQFAEIIEKTAQPFLQPIFDVNSTRIAFGRVLLMGDAAFVARPHVGMGVTKAAEDAMALSDCIDRLGANAAAGLAYEALRLPAGRAVVQRARKLGGYMQSQGSSNVILRDTEEVLRETAVDLGLRESVALA